MNESKPHYITCMIFTISIILSFSSSTISESKKGYSVLLDFVPRMELLSSLEYFDKYFEVGRIIRLKIIIIFLICYL